VVIATARPSSSYGNVREKIILELFRQFNVVPPTSSDPQLWNARQVSLFLSDQNSPRVFSCKRLFLDKSIGQSFHKIPLHCRLVVHPLAAPSMASDSAFRDFIFSPSIVLCMVNSSMTFCMGLQLGEGSIEL